MKRTLTSEVVFIPNRRFGIAAKVTSLAMFGSFAALMLSSNGLVPTVSAASATDRSALSPAAAVPATVPVLATAPVTSPAPVAKDSLAGRLKPGALGRDMMSGMASWYGKVLAGRHTASGDIFDPGMLTAAHRTLPFGTRVRVTDMANHLSVIVKINDRGTLNADRAIDLSYAAAQQLHMVQAGTHPVRLEVLQKNSEDQEIAKD